MPELPEVETVRRGLESSVLGRRITGVEVRHPQVIAGSAGDFERRVRGLIRAFRRKGKALAIELVPEGQNQKRAPADSSAPAGGARYHLVRLGMTGQVTVVPRDRPLEPHTHVCLELDDGSQIRYRDVRRFGRLRLCSPAELQQVFFSLGPDAPLMSPAEFLAALKGRRTPIKNWLLNQGRLAGVGNIYADESLFEARLHPLAEAGRLRRPAALTLHRAVAKTLSRAIALQGTTLRDYIDIEGRPGRFRASLRVYQRTGEPCPRCGAKIRRIVLGGRSTHFCPRCQRRPTRRAVPS